jgi:hypothetical protein
MSRIGEMKNAYNVLVRKYKKRYYLGDVGVDDKLILQEVLGRTTFIFSFYTIPTA